MTQIQNTGGGIQQANNLPSQWKQSVLGAANQMPFPTFQVSSLGSQDPAFQQWQKSPSFNTGGGIQEANKLSPQWKQQVLGIGSNIQNTGLTFGANQAPPSLNPILDKFSQMFSGNPQFRDQLARDPQMQASLFDIDNLIKSNAGISRQKQEGYIELGIDADGKPLYAAPELVNEKDNFRLGESQSNATGQVLDALGAFRTPEEAQRFAQYTKLVGSPALQGIMTRKIAEEGTQGATNFLLQSMGRATMDKMKDPSDKVGVATAFGAYNLVNNWDKMNAAQRSMAMSGLALNGFQYATGETLTKRTLIPGRNPGDPSLNVGQALGLAASGVNVMELMKNWDQMDALQRITYGTGTAAQMVATAKQFGLFGAPMGPGIDARQLGRLGFQAAPSAGVGAIVGPSSSVPPGYTVVASGTAPNTVVAVPQGHEGTAATMNGTNGVTTLNNIQGGSIAALGALQVYSNWGKGGAEGAYNGVVGGTAMAQGLSQMGQTNPYVLGGIVALSALSGMVGEGTASKVAGAAAIGATGVAAYQAATAGTQAAAGASGASAGAAGASTASTLGGVAAGAGAAYSAYKISQSDMSDKDKGKAANEAAKSAVAAYYTFGISALAQYADDKWADGKVQKGLKEYMKYNTLGASVVFDKLGDKVGEAVFGSFSGGTQNKEHMGRNHVRKGLKSNGFFDEGYNVTLANGQKVYAGFDGKDGQHEFRDPSRIPKGGENRSLSAYDIDYTNDLDFSAHLMTSSLMRLMAGGKGTAVDQVAGQLANASIAQIGYGQDMTQDTFGVAQTNVRSFFHQNGIKSKEDAYALANQMFAEQRVTEMDLLGIHQGINMAFDEDGYDTAQMLMAGRWKGIEVAHDVHPIGPNMYPIEEAPEMVRQPLQITGGADRAAAGMQAIAEENTSPQVKLAMHPGMYWGQPTAGFYNQALSEYKDPFIQQPQSFRRSS